MVEPVESTSLIASVGAGYLAEAAFVAWLRGFALHVHSQDSDSDDSDMSPSQGNGNAVHFA